jgi:phospholipase C
VTLENSLRRAVAHIFYKNSRVTDTVVTKTSYREGQMLGMSAQRTAICMILSASLASCASQGQSSTAPMPPLARATDRGFLQRDALPTPIQHVIIIFQENRTPDYLFQGIPGADIATKAFDSEGQWVPLHQVSLAAGYDLGHGHGSFLKDYDNGKLDGFDRGMPPGEHLRPYGYAPPAEVKPYHEIALQYVLADHMFQSNQGPSFPAHFYIIAGRATDSALKPDIVAENPHDAVTGRGAPGGCDVPTTIVVDTINAASGSPGPQIYPCLDPLTLSDLLDAKGVSWRYYQNHAGAGLWRIYDAVRHVRYGPDYANVKWPSPRILTDIASGNLAGVTWVMPGDPWSDHAGHVSTTKGPAWVAAIVNAIGESKYWKNTAIFVTWDDWGGWYDHVKPPIDNYYELGLRVPLLVISPYAKRGYVSKAQHEFGSILAFTEETFGIPKGALQSSDRRADDLMDAFDFAQKPRSFYPIPSQPFFPGPNSDIDIEDP